jgi:hypothetical protein
MTAYTHDSAARACIHRTRFRFDALFPALLPASIAINAMLLYGIFRFLE